MTSMSWTEDELDFLKKATRITCQLQAFADRAEQPKIRAPLDKGSMVDMAAAERDFDFHNPFNERGEVLVFSGDVHLTETLNQRWVNKQAKRLSAGKSLAGVLVDGNLRIDGELFDDFKFNSFVVNGDVDCHALTSENCHMVVRGSLRVSRSILGLLNDGCLEVGGSVSACYLLSWDHTMPRDLEGDYIYIEGFVDGREPGDLSIARSKGAPYGWGWHYFEDSSRLLKPEFFVEDMFDQDAFMQALCAGRNPFHEPA